MQTIIQATNIELDLVTRRSLDSQLVRNLTRYAKDVTLATAYVSAEADKSPCCRIAVLTTKGKRLSTEGRGESHVEALGHAGSQMAAALQREYLIATDPRLRR